MRTWLALALLPLSLAVPAFAQPRTAQSPAPATAPAEAERSTATFGDWTVRCERIPGPPARRQCEMTQTVQAQPQGAAPGQAQAVAQWAVGRTAPTEPFRFVVQLPVNLAFATPVRVVTEGDPPIILTFARCLPIGCFAEVTLGEETLRRLRGRAAEAVGRVEFRDGADRDVGFPLSFRGFGQALTALQAP